MLHIAMKIEHHHEKGSLLKPFSYSPFSESFKIKKNKMERDSKQNHFFNSRYVAVVVV